MHCSNHGTLITTAITSHANTPKSVLSLTLTSGNRECKLQTTVKHAQHNGVQYRTFICAHYHQHTHFLHMYNLHMLTYNQVKQQL